MHEAVLRIVQSDQFQTLWVSANRTAHAQLVAVLTGKTTAGITANSNGEVQLDLSSVSKLVSDKLQSTGISLFSKIPIDKIGGTITLFQSKNLYKIRRAVRVLNTLAWVLPLLVFASFGGAIFLSRNRRTGFVLSAVAFTLGALILGGALAIGRGVYFSEITKNLLPPRTRPPRCSTTSCASCTRPCAPCSRSASSC